MDREYSFPKNFFWGSATSSHQVDGNSDKNDWWEWEQTGKLKERSGLACDHWNRFREDFRLARALNHNAHRFSLEWSRIEPVEGRFNEEALAHYRQVIHQLRLNQLEPIVTLHHFTLPAWLARRGGWLHPQAPQLFARFAGRVAESLGAEVTYWMTLNEPEVYVYKAYLAGDWPPGERSYTKSLVVFARLAKAHVLAYRALHRVRRKCGGPPPQVGLAKGVVAFTSCSDHWKDRLAVAVRDYWFNHFFVKVALRGGIFHRGRGSLDFVGLNYYSRNFIRHGGFGFPGIFGDICGLEHHPEAGKVNALFWEIWPEGIYRLVKAFSRYRLPLLISENGICTERDEERLEFIEGHVAYLGRAMKEGAPVIGYLYWSLLDNYEWAEGFSPHFGMVEVDYVNQRRHARPSALRFAQICQSGKIELAPEPVRLKAPRKKTSPLQKLIPAFALKRPHSV